MIAVRPVEHTPEDLVRLFEQIGVLEADPAEVRVVRETRHGMLVDALLAAGYAFAPVNPDLGAPPRSGEEEGRRRRCPESPVLSTSTPARGSSCSSPMGR
ncbi:MAG: hypothetical protein M0014_13020 [Actinomycetota bacterium]|nr:hypothetical protein [Actinomycetota bacterium]